MFNTQDYIDEINRRHENEEKLKLQFKQERQNNIVPQGIRIPSAENGIIPSPENPLRSWYDIRQKISQNTDHQEQLKAQPNLLSGGNFEYQQPTRQTSYQPDKITTNLNNSLS